MKDVKVSREELLKVLEENRIAHQKIFEEAVEGYKAQVIDKLEHALADARAGKRVLEKPERESSPDVER